MFGLVKQAGSEFIDDDAMKLSASLAYYTIFSIGPFLLVLITLMGTIYERSAVSTKVFNHLAVLLGATGAAQIKTILDNISAQNNTTAFGIVGVVMLIFGATGIFTEIQGSINTIWSIKAKPQKGWLKYLSDRLLSFSLIIGFGFLLVVTLTVDLLLDVLMHRLQYFLGEGQAVLLKILNQAVVFTVVTFLFAIIFKVLPDARVAWRDALRGAACTGVFFLIGKFLVSLYIAHSSTTETYGAAASIIIVLLWVYYTSMILYFGAEFTEVYAMKYGKGIIVNDTAVYVIKREAKELPAKHIPSEKQAREGGTGNHPQAA